MEITVQESRETTELDTTRLDIYNVTDLGNTKKVSAQRRVSKWVSANLFSTLNHWWWQFRNIRPEIWVPKPQLIISVTGPFLTCCLVDMRMFLVARSLWTKRFFSRYIIPHAIWAAHSLRSLWETFDWWSIKKSSSAPIWTNSWTCKTTKYVCSRAIIKRGH